ncbi:ATP-dependent helicase/deoxyribonuclease subunit B [Philodulcilactobacillus myokoensis]|uniref:ATP-dependent helicase/deoxyribonuclease subunit B n=1 Tax=Philodulcilactobacillus myokoensis TaxID=2929573 RepID=A0A9W6B046_9LACO|nr:PD-(D/E)XK nuclease family protein [Philodulcilactobacillus myokoensis]GLB46033.1 ATP-dependent helicase/deoxyribonuclease subunit B [Philodulcilactobacillus myokoensis]
MSLQFILGTASYDHERKLTDDLMHSMQKHPHDQYFYLVPNHIKFESEISTLKRLNRKNLDTYAQTNVQIFSISRLVWYFLKQQAVYQHPELNSSGINMLIYQIILDHQNELTVFRGETGQPGFILQIASQIAEMQAGRISADDLQKILDQGDQHFNSNLNDKMHDFAIIYKAFEVETDGKYLYQADILKQLCAYLSDYNLSHTRFYISGFSQLTAQERELVQILMERSDSVTVDLNLDRPYPFELPDGSNLFYQSAKLYYQLYQFAKQNRIPILTDLHADQPRVNSDLQKLDHYWIASHSFQNIKPDQLKNQDSIQVLQADNPYAEVAQVAIKIRQMVAQTNLHYHDFLIMTRHLDRYQNILKPIFEMQHIPYFNDVQKSMDDHPLVELIDALFSIERPGRHRNYRYQDVMRLLKTELLIPEIDGQPISIQTFRTDLALCENEVLRSGYEGSRWTQKDDWKYAWLSDVDMGKRPEEDQNIESQINLIRHFVRNTLPPFYRKMRRARNGKDAAKILYQFLVQNGVVTRLTQWRDQANQAGRLEEAAQPEQVWDTFCNLLDNFVSILGDRPFKLDDFLALLKAGFEGANYAQIPSTLDQVAVSESGIVQMKDYRIVFMIGSTDDVMPDRVENTSLFNDADRDDLANQWGDDQFLNDNSEMQMANDPYLNYLAFMSGSDRLIFTYCLGSDDQSDSQVKISPYVQQIMRHFNLKESHPMMSPIADDHDVMPFVGTYRTTLRHLIQAVHDAKLNQKPVDDNWKYINQLIRKHPDYHQLANKLLGSLNYQNQPPKLAPKIITDLYGDHIHTSISQLEQFYNDPYEYFLKYGLKLQQRDVFELSPASTGQFFHATLDHLMRIINREHIDLAKLDDQDMNQLVDEVVAKLLEEEDYQYAILNSSNRMNYIKGQLIKTIKRMAHTFKMQSKRTPMRPKHTEVAFGHVGNKDDLNPLKYELPNDREVVVRGRIDRIDEMVAAGEKFLSIIDYKSGNKDFDFSQVYHGNSMQMMTYLDVLQNNISRFSQKEKAEIAGALYLHVYNPKLDLNTILRHGTDISMLDKQRYAGLLVDYPDLMKNLDQEVKNKKYGKSHVFPFKLNKSGTIGKPNKVIEPDVLEMMLDHNQKLIKGAAQRIFDGDIQIYPTEEQQRSAIQYSPYKSIMQFDPLLEENRYHEIHKLSLNDMKRLLEEERNKK